MGILNDNTNNLYSASSITNTGIRGSIDLSPYLKKDGSVAMTDDLDTNNKKIINVAEGTSGSHVVNIKQMTDYIEMGALDIQGSINFKRGSISIDNINSQISAADLNKLYESNSNNITNGKILIYGYFGSLYCDRVKFRHSNNLVFLEPNSQRGNATLFIPNMNGQSDTIALQSYVNKREEKVRGFIEKGEKNVIFGVIQQSIFTKILILKKSYFIKRMKKTLTIQSLINFFQVITIVEHEH